MATEKMVELLDRHLDEEIDTIVNPIVRLSVRTQRRKQKISGNDPYIPIEIQDLRDEAPISIWPQEPLW